MKDKQLNQITDAIRLLVKNGYEVSYTAPTLKASRSMHIQMSNELADEAIDRTEKIFKHLDDELKSMK